VTSAARPCAFSSFKRLSIRVALISDRAPCYTSPQRGEVGREAAGEGGQNGRVFWSHWDSWLFGSSYGISRNRAVPFATTDFVGAFAGAQTSPQQKGIARA